MRFKRPGTLVMAVAGLTARQPREAVNPNGPPLRPLTDYLAGVQEGLLCFGSPSWDVGSLYLSLALVLRSPTTVLAAASGLALRYGLLTDMPSGPISSGIRLS